jgi:hypothetical protein
MLSFNRNVALGAPPGGKLTLGPTIRQEMLTLDIINSHQDENLSLSPVITGQTLSILNEPAEEYLLGGPDQLEPRTIGYVLANAKTLPIGLSDEWVISAISSSELASKIVSELNWVNTTLPDDYTVRIITIPSYQLTTFGLYREETLTYIICLSLPIGSSTLSLRKLYTPSEFISLLRSESPSSGLE